MRFSLAVACMAYAHFSTASSSTPKTVFVFGDSWGDFGPTYHMVQDTLDKHGFAATVRSAAVGGTSACQWAGDPMSMVSKAREAFPDAPNGPDYVWYTLGGNDMAYDVPLKACAKTAKTFADMEDCTRQAVDRAMKCTEVLLDNYFKFFPHSRVLHSGYDIPCENVYCMATVTGWFDAGWCGLFNHTCMNTLMERFHHYYLDQGLSKKYSEPQYTTLNMLGTSQKAGGVPGAEVGKPVLTQGSPCHWTLGCIHPKYKSPPADAIGEVFWTHYFSKQAQNNTGSFAKAEASKEKVQSAIQLKPMSTEVAECLPQDYPCQSYNDCTESCCSGTYRSNRTFGCHSAFGCCCGKDDPYCGHTGNSIVV